MRRWFRVNSAVAPQEQLKHSLGRMSAQTRSPTLSQKWAKWPKNTILIFLNYIAIQDIHCDILKSPLKPFVKCNLTSFSCRWYQCDNSASPCNISLHYLLWLFGLLSAFLWQKAEKSQFKSYEPTHGSWWVVAPAVFFKCFLGDNVHPVANTS